MTNVILSRKEADDFISARAVANKMNNPTVALRTGDKFPDNTERVFRWGCTANCPKVIKINKAAAIHKVFDKGGFRRIVRGINHSLIPVTWFSTDPLDQLLSLDQELPLVLRPNHHERGGDFVVCRTKEQILEASKKLGPNIYISKFYNKSREFRVFIVQGRVVFVIEKHPKDRNKDAWGVDGQWTNIRWSQWPMGVVNKAVSIFKISELDFGAVDIILDVDNNSYVTEVNTAAELSGPYEQSKIAEVFDWMINNHTNIIPTIDHINDWKNCIHPALDERAIVNVL